MVLPLIVISGQIGKHSFLGSYDQGRIVFPAISKNGVDFDPPMSVLAHLDKPHGALFVGSGEWNLVHSCNRRGKQTLQPVQGEQQHSDGSAVFQTTRLTLPINPSVFKPPGETP